MGQVVINILSPLHHIVGLQLAGSVHVRYNVDRDEPGGGQRLSGLGNTGTEDTVAVGGQQNSLKLLRVFYHRLNYFTSCSLFSLSGR